MPALPGRLTQPQTDGPMTIPRYRQTGARNVVWPTGSDTASSVAGAFCPITPDVMMTQCSTANFLGWVRRNFTFHPAQPIDSTMLSTVLAMPALSESAHGDRCKEASDTLHRKYCTNGSRPPSTDPAH